MIPGSCFTSLTILRKDCNDISLSKVRFISVTLMKCSSWMFFSFYVDILDSVVMFLKLKKNFIRNFNK